MSSMKVYCGKFSLQPELGLALAIPVGAVVKAGLRL